MMYLAVIAAFMAVWFVLHLFYGKADESLTASERRQVRVFEEALISGMVGCCVTMLFVLTMVEHFGEEVTRGNVAAHESTSAMTSMGGSLSDLRHSVETVSKDQQALREQVKGAESYMRRLAEIANPNAKSLLEMEDRLRSLERTVVRKTE